MEYKMKCMVCGKVFCYTDEDLKENAANAGLGALSALGSLASTLGGGTIFHTHHLQGQADRYTDKIVDYNQCPDCHSRDLIPYTGEANNDNPASNVPTVKTVNINSGASTEALLKRVFIFLEDGEWETADAYCEACLDKDPESAKAYLGKLMAELHVKIQGELKNQPKPFDNNANYRKAIRYADDELRNTLIGYTKYINNRNENTHKDRVLRDAKAKMTGKVISNYEEALSLFASIPGWKDADEQKSICQSKIAELKAKEEADRLERARLAEIERKKAEEEAEARAKKNKKIAAIVVPILVVLIVVAVIISNSAKKSNDYEFALSLVESGQYADAIEYFTALGDYKDCTEQIQIAEAAMLEEQRAKAYAEAIALMEAGKYDEAHAAFDVLGDYKDSQERLKESLYHQAQKYLEQGNHMAAYYSFCAAGDYGDAKKQLEQFQKMPSKVEYSYADGKGYVAYYDYTANGKILTYWSDDARQRTEYFYNDEGVLIQVKQWNYNHLVNGEPSYYLIDFDANGIPVKYEDTANDIIVEYDHVFAEDGSIKSITYTQSQYSGRNTTRFNIMSATFDFSFEDKTYFVDKQSMGNYLNAFSSNSVYKRYWISVFEDAVDIYEVGNYELDEHGNIIKASVRGGIFNEDGGWLNEYTVENTYDNDGNLIKVVEQDNKTHDTITYEYTYEYIYCPDAA